MLDRVTSGLFWVVVLFSSVLMIERAFSVEAADGIFDALRLSGLAPAAIYAGKVAALAVQLLVVEAVLAVAVAVFTTRRSAREAHRRRRPGRHRRHRRPAVYGRWRPGCAAGPAARCSCRRCSPGADRRHFECGSGAKLVRVGPGSPCWAYSPWSTSRSSAPVPAPPGGRMTVDNPTTGAAGPGRTDRPTGPPDWVDRHLGGDQPGGHRRAGPARRVPPGRRRVSDTIILYMHVPTVSTAHLAFASAIASVMYLWKRTEFWDLRRAVGRARRTVLRPHILNGMLWGRSPGVFWRWEPR